MKRVLEDPGRSGERKRDWKKVFHHIPFTHRGKKGREGEKNTLVKKTQSYRKCFNINARAEGIKDIGEREDIES